MTNLSPQIVPPTPPVHVRGAAGVFWMLLLAPFLMAAGAFITIAMQPFVNVISPEGDALLMAWVGAILLCLGVAFLIAGVTLVGVRSMLQRQTELLLGTRPEQHGGR